MINNRRQWSTWRQWSTDGNDQQQTAVINNKRQWSTSDATINNRRQWSVIGSGCNGNRCGVERPSKMAACCCRDRLGRWCLEGITGEDGTAQPDSGVGSKSLPSVNVQIVALSQTRTSQLTSPYLTAHYPVPHSSLARTSQLTSLYLTAHWPVPHSSLACTSQLTGPHLTAH